MQSVFDLLSCDYIQCRKHQVNMTDQDEYNNHKTDDCNMFPMQYEYKRSNKKRVNFMSKRVAFMLAMKEGRVSKTEVKRKKYVKSFTIPTGETLLDGTFDEYRKMVEVSK